MNRNITQLEKALRNGSRDAEIYYLKVCELVDNSLDELSENEAELAVKLMTQYAEELPDEPSQKGASREKHQSNTYRRKSKAGERTQPQRADNANAADPANLGEPFHNPYTFIPFPQTPPRRTKPTPISIDEHETSRFTGVIDIEVKLLSPLLTCGPLPHDEKNGHRSYNALTVGNDVILPATGVKGALRSLMTIISGGTLSHIDEAAWLCQGRDARLGPAAKATKGSVPDFPFLAEVVKPGGVDRAGILRLGQTKLVNWTDLESLSRRTKIELNRPGPGKRVMHYYVDDHVSDLSNKPSDRHRWKLKLSGRPIKIKGKREGRFLPDSSKEISVSAAKWAAYIGRNRHGDHPELKPGDLVWIEPSSFALREIKTEADIKSIQWARWGREGDRLLDLIAKNHAEFLPDALRPDGKVDEVTNLFGQVPRDDLVAEVPQFSTWRKDADNPGPANAFASRIRFGNLVFPGAKNQTQPVTLAPLGVPHPGCAAFYRNPCTNDSGKAADVIANNKDFPLRGFKVYRTTRERGDKAPWRFDVQGVYDKNGRLDHPQQKMNKTAALLPETSGINGHIRLTVRALSHRELMLLLAACAVDWRLGGGKPLGLGHCRVLSLNIAEFADDGRLTTTGSLQRNGDAPATLPAPYQEELTNDARLQERMSIWQASQMAVERLRYPCAVIENHNKKNMGGHVWFERHAKPRKAVREGDGPSGLQTLHISGDLEKKTGKRLMHAQVLPFLDPANPGQDVLFGYNLFASIARPDFSIQMKNSETHHMKFEPFDVNKHGRQDDRSGGFHGQNRDIRKQGRQDRR